MHMHEEVVYLRQGMKESKDISTISFNRVPQLE